MRRSGIIVTGLIGVALVVGIILAAFHKSNKTTNTNTSQPSSSQSTTPKTSSNTNSTPPASNQQSTSNVIKYDGNGFSPSSLTVKSGDIVTIKNTSSTDVQMDSDPHPIHTDDTDLNVGLVAAGQSQTFTVTKKGTFGFHNHLNPSQTGQISVQ